MLHKVSYSADLTGQSSAPGSKAPRAKRARYSTAQRTTIPFPQPIPYQGSKRNIAKLILAFFPHDVDRLVEPFAGSAAVSVAAARLGRASKFHLNDLNEPLMNLWNAIINDPANIVLQYRKLWKEQLGREREFYDVVRREFNATKRPEYLLYLLARCVKASVRYNMLGEFNQSPDNRRKGRDPARMEADIFAVSHLLKGRTVITASDYKAVLASVTASDLVYMDPPYQGVCSEGDPRYLKGIDYSEFVDELDKLTRNRVSFILSYDGRRGDKAYGKRLPEPLGLRRIEIDAGRSAQSTLLGGRDITYESLYLSPALSLRLGLPNDEEKLANLVSTPRQFALLERGVHFEYGESPTRPG